jgi:phosphoesterase RecJ-like protein
VVSHIDPDGDALGTQLAVGQYLRDLGKRVHLLRDSVIPDKYLFLPGIQDIMMASSMPDRISIDTAIVLECPALERIGTAARFLSENVKVVSIDHHRDSAEFGEVNWVDISASSVGEMIADYFQEVGYQPNRDVATQLYTAILTDTGRFRYQSTTAHTMRVAANLIELGADPRHVCDHVYYNLKPTTVKLIGKVLNGVEFHDFGKICLLSLTKEMFASAGAEEFESDGLVDFTMFNKGVIVGVLLKDAPNGSTKLSLRSSDGVNVAEIAANYGGGGHFNAAGCTIAKPIAQARQEILTRLTEALHGRG